MRKLVFRSMLLLQQCSVSLLPLRQASTDIVAETNIAPDRALFKDMILTPFSTLTRGVDQFLDNSSLTGAVAEIHGDSVTIRPPLEIVDRDSASNLDVFWNLGYA